VTLEQLGLTTASLTDGPVFPAEQIQAITASNIPPEQKATQIKELTNAYSEAVQCAGSGGAVNVKDALVKAVVSYLVNNRGWATSDSGEGIPVINPSDITITKQSDGSWLASAKAVMG